MKIKNIIYDFDGTIADTVGAWINIFENIGKKIGSKKINAQTLARVRNEGLRSAVKDLGIFGSFVMFFAIKKARKELGKKMSELLPFSGMSEVLQKLHDEGFHQEMVTSNTQNNVNIFFKYHPLNFFDDIDTGSNMFAKAKRIKKVIKIKNLNPLETVYIGDEIRDIEAARKAGIRIISVTWGVNSRQALESMHPDFIVDHPEEILDIVTN